VHRGRVKRAALPGLHVAEQRGAHRAVEDAVDVATGACGEACVEVGRHLATPEDSTSGGSFEVAPSVHPRGSRRTGESKCATWQAAWTPASVRPAQVSSIDRPATNDSAASTVACTVGNGVGSGWPCALRRCQPLKQVPSYSMPIA
jgi:hypothetical protein